VIALIVVTAIIGYLAARLVTARQVYRWSYRRNYRSSTWPGDRDRYAREDAQWVSVPAAVLWPLVPLAALTVAAWRCVPGGVDAARPSSRPRSTPLELTRTGGSP